MKDHEYFVYIVGSPVRYALRWVHLAETWGAKMAFAGESTKGR